jgi:hypothetical protein
MSTPGPTEHRACLEFVWLLMNRLSIDITSAKTLVRKIAEERGITPGE